MPRKAFNPNEADERESRFSRGEILTLLLTHSADNPLALNGAAFATYTADKDYAIRSVAVAVIATGVTTPGRGVAGVSVTNPNLIDLFGAVKQFAGGFGIALPFKSEAHEVLEFGADDEKECIYLGKGDKLYGFLRNESADGKSSVVITIRLLPVGKQ